MILCSNNQIIEGMHFNITCEIHKTHIIMITESNKLFHDNGELVLHYQPILLKLLHAEVRCVPLLKHTVIIVFNSINPG